MVLLIGYGRRSSVQPTAGGTSAAPTLAVIALLVAATVVLFLHDAPRSHTTGAGGGSTSDVITFGESFPSLALTAGTVVAGWILARLPLASHRPKQQARL